MSQQYERIMVAVDGSYESELAFIKGVHVAKRNNAQLLLVHVIDTRALQSVATFDSYIYEKLEDEAKAVLADFERQAREAGLTKIRKVIEFGNPKSLLAVDIPDKENVDLNVNTGDITFGGNVTASDGNITIDITGDGNLQDAENKDNTLTAYGPEGSEDAGNIIIKLSGKGDVDLYDLYATNNARLDIADGSLNLHEINGELVAIQLRTEGKDMNVGKITAGTQIVLSGSDMSLDDIAQRPDADGMLIMTPSGASDDKPIDNFTIGNITTNADSGIRFEHLWVNNSDIHMSQGQLWFDKLYVENAAHFSNDDMVAAIYGVPPLRDGSDSVYWNNTAENRPEDNLDMWLNGSGDWMYLRFTDDHIQESNGILLTLDQYDYVYDQRFTAEDHMRWQHGRYLDEDWKQAYGYGLSLHDRYGLIDYQHFTEENAGEDEIAVEA